MKCGKRLLAFVDYLPPTRFDKYSIVLLNSLKCHKLHFTGEKTGLKRLTYSRSYGL